LVFQEILIFYGSHFPGQIVDVYQKALKYPHLDIEKTFESYSSYLEDRLDLEM